MKPDDDMIFAMADSLAECAFRTKDGIEAISAYGNNGNMPDSVVLVATSKNPERLAVLHALHEEWYPMEDDE